jgi:FkbM family methyltransferase
MNRVFVDVGGFKGESSCAALDPSFGFRRVFCFEPVRSCFTEILSNLSNRRLEVTNAGLLDRDARLPIFFPGTLGASVFADAPAIAGANAESEMCNFTRATEFFRTRIAETDRVWMKLNCEGAEVAILSDLINSGESRKLQEVLIDFDAAKIPSARASVAALLELLGSVTFSFHFPEEVQFGMVNNYGGIHNWLRMTCPREHSFRLASASISYQLQRALDARYNGYYKIRVLRRLGLRPPPPLGPSPWREQVGRFSGNSAPSRAE